MRVAAALSPSPKRTEPCGSASISSDLVAAASERGREVDRRRRLADAALLTDDRENLVPRYCSDSSETGSPLRSAVERFLGVPDPALGLRARWRLRRGMPRDAFPRRGGRRA